MRKREFTDDGSEMDSCDSGSGGGGEREIFVEGKAKRALVGAGARILFYPTLMYNVLRNKVDNRFRWWDEVDPFLLLGAVPFPRDVPRLQQLGVQGVVTLNEPFETLVSSSLYQVHGIEHLEIPTRDYHFAPSPEYICQAVDFIHKNASSGRMTYVHCKAGRGRSTTVVLCYLMKYKNMTPADAFEHVRSRRPRVLLASSQWQAVQDFSKQNLDVKNCMTSYAAADEELITEADEVLITEADLEGYPTSEAVAENLSIQSVKRRARGGRMMLKLSCLLSSFKVSNDSQIVPRIPEIESC